MRRFLFLYFICFNITIIKSLQELKTARLHAQVYFNVKPDKLNEFTVINLYAVATILK